MKTRISLLICFFVLFSTACTTQAVTPNPLPEVKSETTPTAVVALPKIAATPTCSMPYFDPTDYFPDGQHLLVKDGRKIFIISSTTWHQDGNFQLPQPINSVVALSPDGSLLAISFEDHTIKLISIADGQEIKTWGGHDDLITELKFTPDGAKLLSASHDTWVKIWDVQGNLLDSFQPTGADNLPSDVLGMGISADGTMLATIPFNGPVKLWDLSTHQQIAEMGGDGGWDTSEVSFSSDDAYLAAALATGLRIWRLSDNKMLAKDLGTLVFKFSPDGHQLAYSDINHNGDVILLDLARMRPSKTFAGNQGWLMFSPDGSLLMSTNSVETRIWNLKGDNLLYTSCNPIP